MNFAKYLFSVLFALNLAVFAVGCGGGDTEATSENDPVVANPEDDPTLDDEATEEAN